MRSYDRLVAEEGLGRASPQKAGRAHLRHRHAGDGRLPIYPQGAPAGEDEGGTSPAIALTAFARSEDRQRAMLAGFDMHISKPVEPAELIAVVARLARRV